MKHTDGFSLIEVLIALSITLISVMAISSLILSSMKADRQSRTRSTINTVAETWLDRYRSNQEPYTAVGTVCTSPAKGSFQCTYGVTHNYAADGVYSHKLSAAELASRLKGYKTIITGSQLQDGTNVDLWTLKVSVEDPARKQTLEVNTNVIW